MENSNRIIKFRAWGKINNKMILDCGPYSHWHFQGNYLKDLDWMQYTGLKDKNGKEIYEGDIVKFTDNGKEDTQEIKWNEAFLAFDFPIGATDIEVIGNIYEQTKA